MKTIIVPVLVALAGWSIRPALADDIHDAPGQAESAYSSGDYGKAKRAADLASTLLGQRVTVSGDAPDEAKRTYASAIDLSALK